MSDLTTELREIARLTMLLGEVKRATRHPSGERETDTTHTVMLALCAARVASEDPSLSIREWLVVRFALVHDLAEAYAGDTVTLHELTPDEQAEKDRREREAVERIREASPWLARLIDAYERQDTPEARLVKVLDKAMPRLLAALNGCRTPQELGMRRPEDLAARMEEQDDHLARTCPDATPALKALHEAGTLAMDAWEHMPRCFTCGRVAPGNYCGFCGALMPHAKRDRLTRSALSPGHKEGR